MATYQPAKNLDDDLGLRGADRDPYVIYLHENFKKHYLDDDFMARLNKTQKVAKEWCERFKVGVEIFKSPSLPDNWVYKSRVRELLRQEYKLLDHDGFCREFKIYEQDERRSIEDAYTTHLKYSGIPDQFKEKRWEDLVIKTDHQRTIIDDLKALSSGYKVGKFGKSFLILTGNNGAGKTMASCLFLKHVIWRSKRQCHYIYWPNLLERLYHSINQNNGKDYEILFKYRTCEFLVLDEIGYDNTEFTMKKFLTIIDKRMEKGFPTMLISDKSEEQLAKMYGSNFNSISSRIFGKNSISFDFNWGDFRQVRQ